MLIEFTVGNFRSFQEPVTLSLEATKLTSQDKSLDENTVFAVDDNLQLLTSAAVYGANASGKSNLATAMKFMQEFVLNSSKETQSGESISAEPFALSALSVRQPSSFEVIFLIDGMQYRYGFEITPSRVTREWLYHTPGQREARLFERDEKGIILAPIAFKEGKLLEERTRENALFLSVVAQFNGAIAVKILDWFSNWQIISGLNDDPLRRKTIMLYRAKGISAEEIARFVKAFDVGVDNIDIENPEVNIIDLNKEDMENVTKHPDFTKIFQQTVRPEIKTAHRAYTAEGELAQPVIFNLDRQESEGTKKIFALAGTILFSLRFGLPLVVDEFDARLHTLLTRAIVKLFNTQETNPIHAQLIFLTHDSNLLDNKLLRRDQIWFVEKDRIGASHLYSLAEFKVRYDASYEQDYIRGKYGAIPFLGDIRRVVEELNA